MSYQLHNFEAGDVLLAEQLNEMDNQIAENNTSKQTVITASGMLKGDGDGGVESAVAETDYATPASVPNSGSVSNAGVLSIKHGNTELFTVQLPLYNGGVS